MACRIRFGRRASKGDAQTMCVGLAARPPVGPMPGAIVGQAVGCSFRQREQLGVKIERSAIASRVEKSEKFGMICVLVEG
ncbi:hypothetical protein [Sphingomonas sp. Leaf62]|uniref:hypothetical protein n=1 Tax=Sphingomonas sp. Leaf62 TaxID=1736228 RepID=UPI000A7DB32F|nr:hypothetical protein [Sphingomonas sp. Leaf62]